MIRTLRTDSDHKDFTELVKLLDAELAHIDGNEHAFYAQFNKLDTIKHAVVVFDNDNPVACGALKEFEPGSMEIKRMYTLPSLRGKGLATVVLKELEKWATELSYRRTVLETGKRQPDAIALYTRNGYRVTPNYGQYAEDENSVCFEKELSL